MSDQTQKSRPLYYHGLLLGIFALVSGTLLAVGYSQTKQDIAARAAEDLQNSLSQVIPTGSYNNNPATDSVTLQRSDGTTVTVYQARNNGLISAVAFEVSKGGYSGEIRLILGLDRDGKILGVRVIKHTETPGLGDKMEVSKGKWIFGFDGLSLGNPPNEQWKVKKDNGHFDQFTGATITPRAIVGAIHEGLEFFAAQREQMLSGKPLSKE